MPTSGGAPTRLALNEGFKLLTFPVWAPDARGILFYGFPKSNKENDSPAWWLVPLSAGSATRIYFPGVERNFYRDAVRAWVQASDGRDWIMYSTMTTDNWKLWRIGSPHGGDDRQSPQLLLSGTGKLGSGGSLSSNGKVAYGVFTSWQSIYQIPTNNRGKKMGPTFALPLSQGCRHRAPSVSRDGRWMVYDSYRTGHPDTIFLRDLREGRDRLLDDQGRNWLNGGDTSISPDGSNILFTRDCRKDKRYDFTLFFPCAWMVPASGGVAEELCEDCTPRGFSADGSLALLQQYDQKEITKDRIVAIDLATKTARDFLSDPNYPVYHAFFSWDDRWVTFKRLLETAPMSPPRAQIMIAAVRAGSPVRPQEWIAVTDGRYVDDKPQFSPDGHTLYFTSTRDGYLCVWGQRLDPATKHPVGAPFAYEHFHSSAGQDARDDSIEYNLSVARDKMLIDLPQLSGDIWMTQML